MQILLHLLLFLLLLLLSPVDCLLVLLKLLPDPPEDEVTVGSGNFIQAKAAANTTKSSNRGIPNRKKLQYLLAVELKRTSRYGLQMPRRELLCLQTLNRF